jgi:dihydroorotase
MSLLIRNITIYDPTSPFHGQNKDVLIRGNQIAAIADQLDEVEGFYDGSGKLFSPGWYEIFSHFSDPGEEQKEDLKSGTRAAKHGGFTHVNVVPNTQPVTDSKSAVEYIYSKANVIKGVNVYPYASVSKAIEGALLSEMLDLHHAGAVGFTDGFKPIWNSELLLKALQYTDQFGGLVINTPRDHYLSQYGQMHEGSISTNLGMKGIPSLAETIMVERDLSILAYAGGRLHFSGISCKESLILIERAKRDGLSVTIDVPLPNLLYTEENLLEFDTNYKLIPPLRSDDDRKALIHGVNTGLVDVISVNHFPQDIENKHLEFDLAESGMIGLQTAYANLLGLQGELDLDQAFKALVHNPRKIMRLDPVTTEVGAKVDHVVFDPEKEWVFDQLSNQSKSANSPLLGKKLKGKCVGLVIDDGIEEF